MYVIRQRRLGTGSRLALALLAGTLALTGLARAARGPATAGEAEGTPAAAADPAALLERARLEEGLIRSDRTAILLGELVESRRPGRASR